MRAFLKWVENHPRLQLPLSLYRRYRRHDIPRQSAALSYYLLFSIFPLLIFFSTLIGRLEIEAESLLITLRSVLPVAVVELCETYLAYVAENESQTLLWFSLAFSVYFPIRAANCLLRGVRRAYGLGRPKRPINDYLRLLIYTLCFELVLVVTLVLTVVGRRSLLWLDRHLPMPDVFLALWPWLRFLVLAVFLFAALGAMYALAQEKQRSARDIVPGAVVGVVVWLVLSMGFSYYVEHFANYSVIYGALGAVIILLVWLYLSAAVMLLGAELNAALSEKTKRVDIERNDPRGEE